MRYEPEIDGKVTMDLATYERLKNHLKTLTDERNAQSKKTNDVLKAAKHLSEFMNHLAKKVDNFEDLVNAFNETTEVCEIQKKDKNRYVIVVE